LVDAIRKRAWPKLVGLHDMYVEDDESTHDHDVNGSTSTTVITPTKGESDKKRNNRRSLQLYPRNNNHHPRSPDSDDDEISITSHMSTHSGRPHNKHTKIVPSLDARQIDLDVARCTWHLLTGTQRIRRLQMEHKRHRKVARLIRRKQRRLGNLINLALVQTYPRTDPERLRYYQGYHDVACIFLSVLGRSHPAVMHHHSSASSVTSQSGSGNTHGLDVPAAVLGQVSLGHLRDCLRPNFSHLQVALRLTIFPLIALMDPQVHEHLFHCDMEPFFALSWVITWFAHEIRDTDLVKRLFDAFLVSHPLFPIYLSIAMVCHPINREEILQTECDFALIHQTLTGLPKNSSMVGWKYRPGDGYVSDDEEEGTVSTDTMDSASLEGDVVLMQAHLTDEQPGEDDTQSLITHTGSLNSLLEPPVRIPYQDLIDTAVGYMRRVPPRHLLQIACRYYGKENVEQILLEEAGEVSLLANPPSWTRAATAPADWVLKQQLRAESAPRRGRKKRSRSLTSVVTLKTSHVTDENGEEDAASVKDVAPKVAARLFHVQLDSTAAIAAGFGIGVEEERRHKKRQKALWSVSVILMIMASLGVAMHSYSGKSDFHKVPENPARILHEQTRTKSHREGNVSREKGSSKAMQRSDTPKMDQGMQRGVMHIDTSSPVPVPFSNQQDLKPVPVSSTTKFVPKEERDASYVAKKKETKVPATNDSDENVSQAVPPVKEHHHYDDTTNDGEESERINEQMVHEPAESTVTNAPVWHAARDRAASGLNILGDHLCSDHSPCSESIAALAKSIDHAETSKVPNRDSSDHSAAEEKATVVPTGFHGEREDDDSLPAWTSLLSVVQTRTNEQLEKYGVDNKGVSIDRATRLVPSSFSVLSVYLKSAHEQAQAEWRRLGSIVDSMCIAILGESGVEKSSQAWNYCKYVASYTVEKLNEQWNGVGELPVGDSVSPVLLSLLRRSLETVRHTLDNKVTRSLATTLLDASAGELYKSKEVVRARRIQY
jgi:hypothetical protein